VPKPLPPNPPLDLGGLFGLLDQANAALGRLDGVSAILPDASLFLFMYVRKEAVLSSQIEGTQSSLSDLLLFELEETPGALMDDVAEVSSYVAALTYGLERLKALPLSLRLLREVHAQLMTNVRGADKLPGEFRRSQNWIGGSRPGNALFVPPPVEHLDGCLDQFERFLHDEETPLPVLIRAGLAHVQFETIHPFLDGNGRLGRLLITLMLCADGVLREPVLYLSLYLKTHRQTYYDHLQSVRETGDWESWLKFFLKGVIETADQATATAAAIRQLFAEHRRMIETSGGHAGSLLKLHSALQHYPVANTRRLKEVCGVSLPTVLRGIDTLTGLGLVQELTGRSRHKLFVYKPYLDILSAGTEPIRR
jgi:Fic family protein